MADILLIDDDVNIHQIVSLFLEDDDHNVSCVSSGQSGLDYAAHNNLDLIILDLGMPGMDGIETYRAIRANPASHQTPIMIFSVHERSELSEDICADDSVQFLNKPVNMAQLKSSVREALV
ncbi:MAG: response regulator [Magnetovibrio sp.]|nr:response regulator [Magnetovibrio sp.]